MSKYIDLSIRAAVLLRESKNSGNIVYGTIVSYDEEENETMYVSDNGQKYNIKNISFFNSIEKAKEFCSTNKIKVLNEKELHKYNPKSNVTLTIDGDEIHFESIPHMLGHINDYFMFTNIKNVTFSFRRND